MNFSVSVITWTCKPGIQNQPFRSVVLLTLMTSLLLPFKFIFFWVTWVIHCIRNWLRSLEIPLPSDANLVISRSMVLLPQWQLFLQLCITDNFSSNSVQRVLTSLKLKNGLQHAHILKNIFLVGLSSSSPKAFGSLSGIQCLKPFWYPVPL